MSFSFYARDRKQLVVIGRVFCSFSLKILFAQSLSFYRGAFSIVKSQRWKMRKMNRVSHMNNLTDFKLDQLNCDLGIAILADAALHDSRSRLAQFLISSESISFVQSKFFYNPEMLFTASRRLRYLIFSLLPIKQLCCILFFSF